MTRRGSAIIFRNNIKQFEEEKYVTRDIQATIVTLEASKQSLTVSAVYCPPRYNIYANDYKRRFDKINSCLIIGGDFNAKQTHWD
jgi:exonuclease III